MRLFALMLWSATVAASGAIADIPEPSFNAETPRATAQGDAQEEANRRLLTQLHSAPVPLSQAIVIAEQLHKGSTTTDVSLEASSAPIYRVRTVKNAQVWENVVDARTGSITGKEIPSSLKELDREDLANIRALKRIKFSLSDAVRIAEKTGAGKALAGSLMTQDGRIKFVIVVVSGDRLKEVMLEPPNLGK